MYCNHCGVELENDMEACPLCGEPVNISRDEARHNTPAFEKQERYVPPSRISKQRKFTWEIISLVLGSGIFAAIIVDLIISRSITWSEYPVAVALAIFCYVSVFAFRDRNIIVETAAGFILSCACFWGLDKMTGGVSWAVRLAMPLLLAVNVIVVLYVIVIRQTRYRGINLIAYAFLGAALLCLCTEGIISIFRSGVWLLGWSIIVTACLAPVIIILLFVHFRLRKGRDLERTFHI